MITPKDLLIAQQKTRFWALGGEPTWEDDLSSHDPRKLALLGGKEYIYLYFVRMEITEKETRPYELIGKGIRVE